ncbi:ATP-binding protein, partial [Omnitrophica bacterium]|nr:ATP-binding protein [Candidatus Omnitrophota bacterium]
MRWTIRRKLIAILLALTLSGVFVVGWRAYAVAQGALEARVGQTLKKQAVSVVALLDNLFIERYRNIDNWISQDIMSDILTEDANGTIRNFLTTMKNEYNIYADIVYADTRGKIIAASRPRLIGQNVIEEKWFQDAFAKTGVQVHGLAFSKLAGQSVVTFAAPVRTDLLLQAPNFSGLDYGNPSPVLMADLGKNNTKTIGVFAAFLDWSKIISLINTMPILEEETQHKGAYAMLINHDGLALTQPYFDKEAVILHENLVENKIQAAARAIEGKNGYTVEKGRYGEKDLIGYASSTGQGQFKGFQWAILVFQNSEDALSVVKGLQAQILGIALLVGFIVSLITFFFARSITKPLVQLAIGAYHIARGDFSQKVKVQSKDELGALASSFNQMTDELNKTHNELTEAKDYVDSIIRSSIDALIVTDPAGKVIRCNPASKTLLGYEEKDLTGKSVDYFLPITSAEQSNNVASIKKGLLSTAEVTFKKKDGTLANMLASATIMKSEQGHSLGVVLMAKDITEYKRLEQQFLHAQKLDAVGRLAGGVAHDFNNMLTIIKIYSERAARRLKGDEKSLKDFDEVLKAADRGARLVRQLLAFSRQDVINAVTLDINELIKDMSKMMNLLVGENVNLEINLSKDVGAIKADSGQIEQVLANLVNNARDAMEGKGHIHIHTENVRILANNPSVSGLKPGEYVLLSVKDTGSGMTEEIKKRIFDPFFTTKEKGRGTGLGLATCYGIITQSGGHVEVDSSPGMGTT